MLAASLDASTVGVLIEPALPVAPPLPVEPPVPVLPPVVVFIAPDAPVLAVLASESDED